jgi:hypothetical protein
MAAAAASAAAVGDVVALAVALVERGDVVALAAALVEGLRVGLSPTAGTTTIGGGFLVGMSDVRIQWRRWRYGVRIDQRYEVIILPLT